VSVGYSVSGGRHHVLAVYIPVESAEGTLTEAAVSQAEDIIEQAQTG
jgi:hypothetical protein